MMNENDIVLDKKSKILFAIFSVLILISIGVTYYKIMIKRDYQILAQVSCDSSVKNCFIRECDMKIGEECEKGEEIFYKLINKNAANVSICDSAKEECPELKCEQGEQNCEYVFCAPDNLDEGEQCSGSENLKIIDKTIHPIIIPN